MYFSRPKVGYFLNRPRTFVLAHHLAVLGFPRLLVDMFEDALSVLWLFIHM
jgi:hypothetical protein